MLYRLVVQLVSGQCFQHRQHGGCLGLGGGQIPVSYTHLDVYKRQAFTTLLAELCSMMLCIRCSRGLVTVSADRRTVGSVLCGCVGIVLAVSYTHLGISAAGYIPEDTERHSGWRFCQLSGGSGTDLPLCAGTPGAVSYTHLNPKFERYIPFNIHFCEFNVLFPRVQSGAASVGDRNCSASSEFAG